MKLLYAGLILFVACSAHPAQFRPVPYRIPGFAFAPPLAYVEWIAQAHNCAYRLRVILGDSARFTVDAEAMDLSRITWIAVPTERRDERFAAALVRGDSLFVLGMTSAGGDTIWLPAPRLESSVLVKHEAMHVFVQSSSEVNYGPHGLPWGFCEFL